MEAFRPPPTGSTALQIDGHRLITVREVATILNVSVRTVWRLRSARKITPPIRVGGVIRWRKDELLQWISEGCQVVHENNKSK